MKKEADTILYYAVKKHWHGGVFVRVYLSEKKKKKKATENYNPYYQID